MSNKIFVLSAPAGTGKTTLVDMLTDELPNVVRSISCTTRQPREGERDGFDYFFLTPEEFKKRIETDDFLEWAEVFGHYYGTSKQFVNQELSKGNHVFLVIDTQGALQLMKKIQGVFIFISPPSRQEQRARLKKRSTEPDQVIGERLKWADREMAQAVHYDYTIVNRDLQIAYQQLKNIVMEHEQSDK